MCVNAYQIDKTALPFLGKIIVVTIAKWETRGSERLRNILQDPQLAREQATFRSTTLVMGPSVCSHL